MCCWFRHVVTPVLSCIYFVWFVFWAQLGEAAKGSKGEASTGDTHHSAEGGLVGTGASEKEPSGPTDGEPPGAAHGATVL